MASGVSGQCLAFRPKGNRADLKYKRVLYQKNAYVHTLTAISLISFIVLNTMARYYHYLSQYSIDFTSGDLVGR